MNQDKQEIITTEKRLQKARSSRRFFGLFIAIDVILFGVVIYLIVEVIISLLK